MSFYDRVKMSVASTGTGTLLLGDAQTGFRSFATAGVSDGEQVSYAIEDEAGLSWEVGQGVYDAADQTLTRTVWSSSNGNAAIDLSGQAVIWLNCSAHDLGDLKGDKGDKGDPGGAPAAVGLFSDLDGLNIPVGTDLIETTGWGVKGVGGGKYIYDAAVDAAYVAANPYTSKVTNNNRGFRLNELVPNVQQYGVRGGDGQAYTAQLQAFFDDIAGRAGHWPKGEGTYLTGRINPSSNTVLHLDGGLVVNGVAGGTNVMRWTGVDNFTIVSGGAEFFNPSTAVSHTWVFEGASHINIFGRVKVRGGGINGLSQGRDSIYIGMNGATACSDFLWEDVTAGDALRNGLSIAGLHRALFIKFTAYGTTGAPGAGVDVEQNTYGNISGVRFMELHSYGNQTYGFAGIFGQGVVVDRYFCSGNGISDILIGAGGAQYNDGVARSGTDWIAVTNIDTTNGRLTVSHPENLQVGQWLIVSTRLSGTKPGEYNASTRWCVHDKPTASTIVLAIDPNAPIVALANAGSAGAGGAVNSTGLSADPALSQIYLSVIQEGQSSNYHFRNVSASSDVAVQIDLQTSIGVTVSDSREIVTPLNRRAVRGLYSRALKLKALAATGDRNSNSAAANPYSIAFCSDIEVQAEAKNFSGSAAFSNIFGKCKVELGLHNVGWTAGRMIENSALLNPRFEHCKGRTDPDKTVTQGIFATTAAGVVGAVYSKCDMKGVGSSNGNSLSGGVGAKYEDCVRFDGTTINNNGGGLAGYAANTTAAGATNLRPGVELERARFATTFTADVTCTVSTSGAVAGKTRWYVSRVSGGAFQLILQQTGGSLIATLGRGEWATLEFDGANYVVIERGRISDPINPQASDAAFTAKMHTNGRHYRLMGNMTDNRAVTLSAVGADDGDVMTFVRGGDAGGPWLLSIGALKDLSANTGCEIMYDGTAAAWKLERTWSVV